MDTVRQHPQTARRGQKGFTLIELLVVITIMSVITLVLLIQQNKFDSSTLLRSLAYNVALSVRQTQVYGTSVYGASSTSGATSYAPAYGLYFSESSPQTYILFADTNGDGQYDSGDTVLQTFTLGNGYSITNICAEGTNVGTGGHVTRCSTYPPADIAISFLEVLFKRPDLDAQFLTLNGFGVPLNQSSSNPNGDVYSSGYIVVGALDGTTRAVSVSTTGQIVVWAPNTTPP